MKNGLTLVTPTSDRPAGMRLCVRWMQAQTFDGPVLWLVVDRGRQKLPAGMLDDLPDNWTVRHITPQLTLADAKPVVNFRANLATGLSRPSPHDRFAIIEDDDHYKPGWLQWLSDQFDDGAELIGESRSRYYDVAGQQWRQMANPRHASLCQTAFSRRIADWLSGSRGQLRPPHGPRMGWKVDIHIWRFWRERCRAILTGESRLVTGMKNLPGRDGLTHRTAIREGKVKPDPHGRKLRQWVGDEVAAVYSQFASRPVTDIWHVSEFLRASGMVHRPAIVIGKGPTYDRAADWQLANPVALSVGLNHVVARRYVDIAHVVDVDVLDQVPEACWFRNATAVAMPWRPHVNFRPTDMTLEDLRLRSPLVQRLFEEGRLMYYNLSTALPYGLPVRPKTPDIQCSTFSGEAVCRLLRSCGVDAIHTAGLDGGRDYHPDFANLQPLTNGASSFDTQTARLATLPNIIPVA